VTKDKRKPKNNGPIVRFFANLGPGLITGAADDDPSTSAVSNVLTQRFELCVLVGEQDGEVWLVETLRRISSLHLLSLA
jgi:hypothetical protein